MSSAPPAMQIDAYKGQRRPDEKERGGTDREFPPYTPCSLFRLCNALASDRSGQPPAADREHRRPLRRPRPECARRSAPRRVIACGWRAEDGSAGNLHAPLRSSGREFQLIGSSGFPAFQLQRNPHVAVRRFTTSLANQRLWMVGVVCVCGGIPTQGNVHEDHSIGIAGLCPCRIGMPGVLASPSNPDCASPCGRGSKAGISRSFASREASTRSLTILGRPSRSRRSARPCTRGSREHRSKRRQI
jgi:hypothetical protein